jgi:hypothetical protein
MTKTKKTTTKAMPQEDTDKTHPESETEPTAKLGKKLKIGNLGNDLSRRFSPSGKGAWRPTKPGGRMKSGKPG